jgi:hypothetical protein
VVKDLRGLKKLLPKTDLYTLAAAIEAVPPYNATSWRTEYGFRDPERGARLTRSMLSGSRCAPAWPSSSADVLCHGADRR